MNQTDYDKQAHDFLARFGLRVTVGPGKRFCPPWAEPSEYGGCEVCQSNHGLRHHIIVRRGDQSMRFDFWNSLSASAKSEDPSAYTILSCAAGDLAMAVTFKDFCADTGTNDDSMKALADWKRCDKHAKKLRGFFTAEEAVALADIQ